MPSGLLLDVAPWRETLLRGLGPLWLRELGESLVLLGLVFLVCKMRVFFDFTPGDRCGTQMPSLPWVHARLQWAGWTQRAQVASLRSTCLFHPSFLKRNSWSAALSLLFAKSPFFLTRC